MNNYFMHGGNTETIDSYVMQIRQVATFLGYGEPQVLEVFKKHTSNKIVLDTIFNRRPKTSSRKAKRILTKEKLDKQLTGQTSTSPLYEY